LFFFRPRRGVCLPEGDFFPEGNKKKEETEANETPQRGLFPGGKQKEVLPKAILWFVCLCFFLLFVSLREKVPFGEANSPSGTKKKAVSPFGGIEKKKKKRRETKRRGTYLLFFSLLFSKGEPPSGTFGKK
jgi:hypothetical protein